MINCAYGFFILPESLSKSKRRKFSWAAANPFGSLKGLARSPLLIGLAAALLLLNVSHYVYQSVWVLYTGYKFGWGTLQVGISLAVVGVMAAIVQGYLGRKILPRWGERKAMLIGLTVMSIEMVGFGLATAGWQIYVLVVFGSIGGLATPAMQGLMSRHVGDDEQGWLQGANTSLASLAGIFAPILMTGVFSFFIAKERAVLVPGAPFFLSAVLMAAAAVVALRCAGGAPKETS